MFAWKVIHLIFHLISIHSSPGACKLLLTWRKPRSEFFFSSFWNTLKYAIKDLDPCRVNVPFLYCQKVIWKLILNRYSISIPFKNVRKPYHVEISPLICSANQGIGFYMIGFSDVFRSYIRRESWSEMNYLFLSHCKSTRIIFRTKIFCLYLKLRTKGLIYRSACSVVRRRPFKIWHD